MGRDLAVGVGGTKNHFGSLGDRHSSPPKSPPMPITGQSTNVIVKTADVAWPFFNHLILRALPRATVEKKRFFERNYGFPAPIFVYMQLLYCRVISHWKELFKRQRMTYYLSINVFIW